MTPSELNQFLNTPRIDVSALPKTNTLNYGAIIVAGITVVAVVYAVHLYLENEELRFQLKKS